MSETLHHEPLVTGIAGELQPPLVTELDSGDGIRVAYHWATPEDLHTFLHVTLAREQGQPFALAQANLDSSDIRGQGDALWAFLGTRLQEYSNNGFLGSGPLPIVHQANTNEYSRRLPSTDPRYRPTSDSGVFLGLYMPEEDHSGTTHSTV